MCLASCELSVLFVCQAKQTIHIKCQDLFSPNILVIIKVYFKMSSAAVVIGALKVDLVICVKYRAMAVPCPTCPTSLRTSKKSLFICPGKRTL